MTRNTILAFAFCALIVLLYPPSAVTDEGRKFINKRFNELRGE